MKTTLISSAVMAAINCSWEEAVKLNAKILFEDPDNIETLNRLAYAYMELGNCGRAQKYYKKTLSFDPYNPIAQRNLKKIIESGNPSPRKGGQKNASIASLFLEEQGKTKLVSAVKLAGKGILNRLRPGDLLTIVPKKHCIALNDEKKVYIASLPDDISFRLKEFINKGNQYECYVRSVDTNYLSVFLREVFRSNKLKNTVSFCAKIKTRDKKNQEQPAMEADEGETTESFEEKEGGESV